MHDFLHHPHPASISLLSRSKTARVIAAMPLALCGLHAHGLEFTYSPWKLIDLTPENGSFAHEVARTPAVVIFPANPKEGDKVTQLVDYEPNAVATFFAPEITFKYELKPGQYLKDTGYQPAPIEPHRVPLDRTLTWTYRNGKWPAQPEVNVTEMLMYQPKYWTRQVSVVPEPDASLLLALGVTGMAGLLVFRKRNSSGSIPMARDPVAG